MKSEPNPIRTKIQNGLDSTYFALVFIPFYPSDYISKPAGFFRSLTPTNLTHLRRSKP